MTVRKVSATAPDLWDETRFCRPECLLLDSLRLWSQTPSNLEHIRRMLTRELGPDAAFSTAKSLKFFCHVIGLHARRTLQLMHPGVLSATADERTMLALIGAVLHGRRTQAKAIAEWLLPPQCHGTVIAIAGELGRSLRSGGMEIPPPRSAQTPVREPMALSAVG